jgi:DNA repair protein RadD
VSFTLRPYQQAAADAGVASLAGEGGGLLVLPPGAGKSIVIQDICSRVEGDTVVFQPNSEILLQNQAKMVACGMLPRIFSASVGRRDTGRVTLATIGTAINAIEEFEGVANILIDECHLVSPRGGTVFEKFLRAHSEARAIGMTATPYRLASNSMGSEMRFLTRTRPRVFTDLVHYTQIRDLLPRYLCPLEYRQLRSVDIRKLKINSTGADFTDQSVEDHLDEIDFGAQLARVIRGLIGEGRKHIAVFTRRTADAQSLADDLGDAAEVVSAKSKKKDRRDILEGFRRGTPRVVSNVGVISAGYDFPALDTVVLARPTRSLALFCQQVGRALRKSPGKKNALIVDMVGNVRTFGKVEDMVLRPGGVRGKSWSYFSEPPGSRPRQLTNVHY